MTSVAQIKANRRNARKSSGPKSKEGKITVSKNALTYGIFSNIPLLSHENEEEFRALCENIANVFPAVDAYAASLVERIIICVWRQQRLRAAEAAKLTISLTPEAMMPDINEALHMPYNKLLTAKDISQSQETKYQYFVEVLGQFNKIKIASVTPSNLDSLKEKVPKVYEQLELHADDWATFCKDAKLITSSLEKIKADLVTWIETNEIKHTGFTIAQQLKSAKLVPMGSNLEFLSKYQTQLDTDLYRAIDAYKRHIEWRQKHIEIEVGPES